MKLFWVIFGLVASASAIMADEVDQKKPEITKLQVADLSEIASEVSSEGSEVQRKRDSGYAYPRPSRFGGGRLALDRFRAGHSSHRGRLSTRRPGQVNRPFNTYGLPNHQQGQGSSGKVQPTGYHHSSQQFHQSQSQQRPNGAFWNQDVPSPIRNLDFVEASPIASQNTQPFGINSANYLPPGNQKPPTYTPTGTFSAQQPGFHNLQGQVQDASLESQGQGLSADQQISDAALFLAENAQAISQLYGAPATDESFAPNYEFREPQDQFQDFKASDQSRGFPAPLPSYASGTLSNQELLEQIKSMEKDRLISQLQQALVTQNTLDQGLARYAQSFSQGQLLEQYPPLDRPSKLPNQGSLGQSPGVVNSGNAGFGQVPFSPGTTLSPGFTVTYGPGTTTQPPITTTTTTSTSSPPASGASPSAGSDGSTQTGSSLPAPGTHYFPQYGGFVPTILTGTGLVPSQIPNYGILGTIPGSPSISAGSSPTHFNLPIPLDPGHKVTTPASFSPPVQSPGQSGSHPGSGSPSTPNPPASIPVQPVHPIRPISPALHPLFPAAGPTIPQFHPPQTPVAPVPAHPTYGLQPAVFNPLLYKPVKPIYPVLYYPNAFQLQKPTLPVHPWSYAPSFIQAKPAQIWK
ncbi:ataxin-2-like protein [Orussus abietinus]|uniref:ataxin-2-like protein n=1 Tax=Orussus abietinus TaxID=222816 RepID=UPI000625C989|nr:ataxin-2-like protein [Orussus abietinus]